MAGPALTGNDALATWQVKQDQSVTVGPDPLA